MIADFTMAGGKRIRPAMVYYGYLAAGGQDGQDILEVSMSIELVHSFLLIHDDIIDRDEKRHGVETIHERYRKIGQRVAPHKDALHFGNSMAMITGDMASAMAYEIIFNSKFPPETIIRALDKLQDIVYVTIPGEMLDVVMENRGYATEKEILRMFEGKTSRYTFEGPLHLGTILAGLDLAGRAVDERVELGHLGTADLVDEPLDHAAVQAADQVGVLLGQRAERAVGEGHDGTALEIDHLGVESESGLLADERVERGRVARATAAPCSRPWSRPASTISSGVSPAEWAAASNVRARVGHRRGLEAERRGVGGQGVAVLGPTDLASRRSWSRRAVRPRACARGGAGPC